NKDELSARLQNSQYFLDRSSLVFYATEHQGADNRIGAAIWNRQFVRNSVSCLDLHSESRRLFFEILIHEGIRLDADPLNAVFRKVSKVGTRARSDLQDTARKIPKKFRKTARAEGGTT